MTDISIEPLAPPLPMTTYWVIPALGPGEAFRCFYYSSDWTSLVTGPLECDTVAYETDFVCIVAGALPPVAAPHLPTGFTAASNVDLVGAVAQTLGPLNYLQPYFGAQALPGAGPSPLIGVVLSAIPNTDRGVILVFAAKDGFGNVLGLVASQDPEIKNSTGPGKGGG